VNNIYQGAKAQSRPLECRGSARVLRFKETISGVQWSEIWTCLGWDIFMLCRGREIGLYLWREVIECPKMEKKEGV
jgi:hypothetical protein